MIDRKMSRHDFWRELMARVMRRIDIVTASDAEFDRVIHDVADEMATEIRAYWASRELEARRELGEKPN